MKEQESFSQQSWFTADGQGPIPVQRFAHQAMATVFEIVCAHDDLRYAEQASRAAFSLIDRLESELTCHRSSSDISRINRSKPGEEVSVGLWAMECLLLARYFHAETHGAFDISLGSGLTSVEMVPEDSIVKRRSEAVSLDLGGIGKGYAVDRVAELLHEWEIDRAMIHGGFSSVLVLDTPPDCEGWPMTISVPGTSQVLEHVRARHRAWSASGIRKKDHIVDPRTGVAVRNRLAAWVSGTPESLHVAALPGIAPSPCAGAEALSTAFMIMPLEEIADYCLRYPGVEVRVLITDPLNCSSHVLVRIG